MKMMPTGKVQPQQPAPRHKGRIRPPVGVLIIAMIVILGIVFAYYLVLSTKIIIVDGMVPCCALHVETSDIESGKTQVNVTWTVLSPSRSDVKWSDIPQASAKIVKNGTLMSSGFTWKTWPTGTYVTYGDIIRVTLNRASVASGSVVKLILIYAPTGSTSCESSVTLNYTA